MKRVFLIFLVVWVVPKGGRAQFPPPAGQPGSTAIHADSSIIVGWATSCTVVRGYVNISDTSYTANGSNRASYGSAENALGKADNQVVSLGDGGQAILSFYPLAITNGPGFDFVVFENAFSDSFLELAFVEVSSDRIHYYRFPAVSLTPTTHQIGPFDTLDTRLINNLAGKYRALYGTPFDLDDLTNMPENEKTCVQYVRIIDVIGSIDPALGSYDSQGHLINDPFPTPFASCGFDLDAVGIINATTSLEDFTLSVPFYPNPASDIVYLRTSCKEIILYDASLKLIQKIQGSPTFMDISGLQKGVYFLCLNNHFYKLLKF